MAAGDLTLYQDLSLEINAVHDMAAHAFKAMLITSAVAPTAADPAATAKASYTEVTGANYSAGGLAVDGTWTEAAGTATFDFAEANVVWAQDGSGFANARWAIIYNSTTGASLNHVVAFIDLGAVISTITGSLTITFGVNGIFTLS